MAKTALAISTASELLSPKYIGDKTVIKNIHKLDNIICEHSEAYIHKIFIWTKDYSQLYKGTVAFGHRDYITLSKPICFKCFKRWKLLMSLAGNNVDHMNVGY